MSLALRLSRLAARLKPTAVVIKEINALCKDLHQIGLPAEEVKKISAYLLSHQDVREYWADLAVELRPHYFSETHFHAAELVYNATHSRFKVTYKSAGNCGILFQRWGRLREAIEWFHRSIALNPDYGRSFHNLGFCLELIGEFESAGTAYRKALALDQSDPATWNGLGNCLWEQGQTAPSLDAYRRALSCDPAHEDSIFNLAVRLASRGEFQEAANLANTLRPGPNTDYLLECVREKQSPKLEPGFFHTFPRARLIRVYIHPDNPAWPSGPLWDATLKLADDAERLRRRAGSPRPQIFLSYRGEDHALHGWIKRLARDLVKRGYRVVLDYEFGLKDDRVGIPLVVQQLAQSDYFVPILTEPFRRAVEFSIAKDQTAGPVSGDSVALDEWLAALQLAQLGRIKLLGIWRSGPVVPSPFTRETVLDARENSNRAKVLAAFPKLRHTGEFVEFQRPTTHNQLGQIVTHSATVTFSADTLDLSDFLLCRLKAQDAIVKQVS